MLAYLLAILVGGGSVGLYIGAFFFPEVHRKHDFLWSSVGCFYALALWIYARQITGGILVGQTAGVALLGWFAWQTLKLRRQLVPIEQQTPLPSKKTPPPKVSGSAKVAKSRLEKATAANIEPPAAPLDLPVELPITPPPDTASPPPTAAKPIGRAMPPAPPPPPVTPAITEDLPVEFETDTDESAWIELTLTPPTEIEPKGE
jgi:hypothetical protein